MVEYSNKSPDRSQVSILLKDAQAAVGIAQLNKLDGHNAKWIELAHHLTERLKGTPGIRLPYE